MFSAKCANPDCQAVFDYRRGQLYRFRRNSIDAQMHADTHSVAHFWLCDRCSDKYRLEYRNEKSVLLRREGGLVTEEPSKNDWHALRAGQVHEPSKCAHDLFFLFATLVPELQGLFEGTTPRLEEWATSAALAGTFWIEVWKLDGKKRAIHWRRITEGHFKRYEFSYTPC